MQLFSMLCGSAHSSETGRTGKTPQHVQYDDNIQ